MRSERPALPTTEILIARVAELTGRELQVARLVGRGLSNDEIAQELDLCQSTVKTHLTVVFDKLRARNRIEVAIRMWTSGLMRTDSL